MMISMMMMIIISIIIISIIVICCFLSVFLLLLLLVLLFLYIIIIIAEGAPHGPTPGLHNKIPALKTFARGWVAQESNAKIFQGLGPKRRESCNGDRV